MSALLTQTKQSKDFRKIIHVDMDCFFAAVEELDNPALRGRPIAVGGSPTGRGVLCTANYEARKFGVRSAMSSAEALRLCPQLTFIKPRSRRYNEIGNHIRNIFYDITSVVQPLSIDEAFLDVSDCKLFNGTATLIAQHLKQRIHQETGLTASAGVAPNKFLAKIASDWEKPNGLFVIKPHQAADFARDLPIGLVPGIGKVTEKRCHELGLKQLGDIHHYPLYWLEKHFGKFAHSLYQKSFGVDERPVEVGGTRKSLGHEETYHEDLLDFQDVLDRIPFLVEEVYERFKRHSQKYPEATSPTKVFIKAKTNQFKGHTYERLIRHIPLNLDGPTDLLKNYDTFVTIVSDMFKELYERLNGEPLRLLGLGFRLATSSTDEQEKNGQLRLL